MATFPIYSLSGSNVCQGVRPCSHHLGGRQLSMKSLSGSSGYLPRPHDVREVNFGSGTETNGYRPVL